MAKYCTLAVCMGALVCSSIATATPPSETVLPKTTKGFFSVPDVAALRDSWNETQIGRMMNDPVMKPFVDDLREQLKRKISSTQVRLGLSIDDLKGIYGGELTMALVQPDNDAGQHATVLIVDVTGHLEQVEELLKKIDQNLTEQGAARRTEQLGDHEATVFTMPKKREDSPTVETFYVLHNETLIVCDHQATCEQLIVRLDGGEGETLADLEAFRATMSRIGQDSGDMTPHIRWFLAPFGYAEALRASSGGRKRKGPDLLKVLPNQGFDAIKGIGGYVFFSTGEQEVMHRTMVYAPAKSDSGDAADGRFRLAARMLEFPNTNTLVPQDFVSRDLGSYFTFNWKMKEAFEHSKTLVNELLGGGEEDDLMEEIIVGLAKDKDGPQVDLRTDLVAHFAERASMITDCRRPITPESERLMFAIELTDADAVRATIDKAFDADPDAEKRVFEEHVIWEIIKDDQAIEVEELQIEGGFDEFDPFGEANVPNAPPAESEEKILPNSAITVANGHLIVASHVDFIVEMLQRPVGTDLLSDAADYQQITDALAKIGADESSFRFFARTDETYRPTYELIRQGKMPQSKTLLGKLLNELLGPDEKGILREQQIDGTKMPDFDAVRRYLGPSGMFVRSEENGWYMGGCLLSKDMRIAAQAPSE